MSSKDQYEPEAKRGCKSRWIVPLFLGAIGYGTYQYLNQGEQAVETTTEWEPEILFEDLSADVEAKLEEEFDMAQNLAMGRCPSIDMVSRGVNMFNGDSFGSRPRGAAWAFTYNEKKTFSEPFNWQVPDQIIGTPSVTIQCATAGGVSELFDSHSLEQIDTTIKDTQTGYRQQVDITGGIKAGPATFNAKATSLASMNYGNSDVERNSKQSYKEGYRSSFSNQARARIFEIEMDGFKDPSPMFLSMYQRITDDLTAFNFVKLFGTHWIEKAQFGAQFDKVIYIEVDKNLEDVQHFKQTVDTEGFSVFGFGHSVTTTKKNFSRAMKKHNVKKIKVTNFNAGSVDFSGLPACAYMGKVNAPVMVDQQIRPYWVLPGVMHLADQSKALKDFMEKVYKSANTCRKTHCGDRGDCKPKLESWSVYNQMPNDFADFWFADPKKCLPKSLFAEQKKKDKAAEEQKAKEAEKAAYKESLCVWMYDGYKQTGSMVKKCVDDSPSSTNLVEVNWAAGMNDVVSSAKVGSNAALMFYMDGAYNGQPNLYRGPWTGNVYNENTMSSYRIFNKNKMACVYQNYNQQGWVQCFTYPESTGYKEYNLHYFNAGDTTSSVSVPEGMQIKAWDIHSPRRGNNEVWGPGNHNVNYNDCWSVLLVCRNACPY